jgi:hypothetical protein
LAIHDVTRLKHPVIVKVKDHLRTKRREKLVNAADLIKSTLTPQAIEKPHINRLKVLVFNICDVVHTDIIKFGVVVAKVRIGHFQPVKTAASRVSVVNDANSHVAKIKQKSHPLRNGPLH